MTSSLLPAFLFFLSLPSLAAFRGYPNGAATTGAVLTGTVKTSGAYSKDLLNRVYDAFQEEFPDKFDEAHEGADILQQKMEEAIFQGKITDLKKALFFLHNKFSAPDWKIRAAALRLTPYFLSDLSSEEEGALTARQIFQAVLDRYSPDSPEGHPFCLSAAVEVSLKILGRLDFRQDLIAKSMDYLQALAVAPKSNSFVAKAAFNAQAEILSQYQAPETSALKTLESVREILREEIESTAFKGVNQAFTLPVAVNAAEAVIVHYPLPEETTADALYDFLNVDQEFPTANKATGTAFVRLLPRLSSSGQTALAVRVIDKIERNKDSMADSFRIAAFSAVRRLVTNIDLPPETARKAAFFLAESFSRTDQPLLQKIAMTPLFFFIASRGTSKNSNEDGSSLVATERNDAPAAFTPDKRNKEPLKRLDNLLSLEEKTAVLKPIFDRSLEIDEEIDAKERRHHEIVSGFILSVLWNAEFAIQAFLLQEIKTALSAGALPAEAFAILKRYITVARKSGLPISAETAALVVEHAVNPVYTFGRHFIWFVKHKILPLLSESDKIQLGFIIAEKKRERKAWQDLIDRHGGQGLDHKDRMDVFMKILDRLPEDEEPNPQELLALEEPLFPVSFPVSKKKPKKKRRRAAALTQEKAAGEEAPPLQTTPLEAAPLQDSACLAAVRSGGD